MTEQTDAAEVRLREHAEYMARVEGITPGEAAERLRRALVDPVKPLQKSGLTDTQADIAEVEALAELLSWATGEFTQWFADAHPDHNRWSWRGDGHGAPTDRNPIRDDLRTAARRVLASDWLAAREAAARDRGNLESYRYVHRLLGDESHEVIEEHVASALAAAEARGAQAAVLPIERFAQAAAVTARANGRGDEERLLLDLLILTGREVDRARVAAAAAGGGGL